MTYYIQKNYNVAVIVSFIPYIGLFTFDFAIIIVINCEVFINLLSEQIFLCLSSH